MSSPRKVRVQILMPAHLKRRAQAKAAQQSKSLAEYVRRIIAQDLGSPKPRPKADISVIFDLVADGPRTNIARDKDRLLGEAVWQEHLRKTGQKDYRRRK